MRVTDLEIVEGRHYHAWALGPSMHTFTTGRTMTQLAYTAAKQPHTNRSTARRHAKQMAAADFGPSGYMALLCGGGEACPYTFEPWEPNFLKASEGGGNDNSS